MKTFACLLFSLLVASCCLLAQGQVPRRQVNKTLTLNNGIGWGTWGKEEYCKEGSFATHLEAKFEDYTILDTDETGLNAVTLYCFDPSQTCTLTGHVQSTVGEKGEWKGVKGCGEGYLTSMRARVLDPQGALGDDVAVQNVQMECDYGQHIITAVEGAYAARIPLGKWGEWSACPRDTAICGVQTRYNAPSMAVDDAGICDMRMFCCPL